MNFGTSKRNMRNADRGLTLVEVVMALAIVLLLTGGLYAIGYKARAFSEHQRISAEARLLAKARMEEIIAYGADALAQPFFSGLAVTTNQSSRGYAIILSPMVVWHAPDGTVVSAQDAKYAEVHVSVSYFSPFIRQWREENLVTILEREPSGGSGP